MNKEEHTILAQLLMAIDHTLQSEKTCIGFLEELGTAFGFIGSAVILNSSHEDTAPRVINLKDDDASENRVLSKALELIQTVSPTTTEDLEFHAEGRACQLFPLAKPEGWLLISSQENGPLNKAIQILQKSLPQLSNALHACKVHEQLLSKAEEQRESVKVLQYNQDRTNLIMQSISDPLIKVSSTGQIEEINLFATKLLGLPHNEATKLNIDDLLSNLSHQNENVATTNELLAHLKAGKAWNSEESLRLLTMKGKRLCLKLSSAPVEDNEGNIESHILTLHDITKTELAVLRANWQASHDTITHLLNRRGFEEKLNETFSDASPAGSHHAVMHLDLDQFKIVNDTCGHQVGDNLIQQIAMLIRKELRDSDIIGRIGGDEFGIVLTNSGPTKALKISENIRKSIAQYRFAWQEKVFNPTISIGLTNLDTSTSNAESALKEADLACLAAKDNGRNQVHMYREVKGEHINKRVEEMEWVSRITRAIESDNLVLFCQGIYPLNEGEPTHIELLVRMRQGDDLIPPGAFLPAAERYGKIQALDRWVVQQTIDTLIAHSLKPVITQEYRFNINLSGPTLGDETTQKFIATKLRKHPEIARLINFEITETAAIANLSKSIGFIDSLRSLGCNFILDDFGTGLSSFIYLKQLPVSQIKIDGTFIKDICVNSIDEIMVISMKQIAEALNIKTVAEFVEDEDILELIREIGIDYAQGYGLELPLLFEDKLEQLLSDTQSKSA